ncbi:MAG: hypothetical protein JSS65_11695 [Armatimonadetes bacterium]|nr:hypothetical protein [Armatimonadota bacterium]
MEPDLHARNELLRSFRQRLGEEARARVDRVAVSAVAAGEKLGLADPALMAVREAAELWPHAVVVRQEALDQGPWLGAAVMLLAMVAMRDHGAEDEVVALAWALDFARYPGEMTPPASLKRSAWMPDVLAAFEAIDPVIQPMGNSEDS